METKIYAFQKNKSRVVALIFAIIGIIACVFAAFYASSELAYGGTMLFPGADIVYFGFGAIVLAILTLITSVVGLILMCVAVAKNAKLFLPAAILVAAGQCIATVMVLLYAVKGYFCTSPRPIGGIFVIIGVVLFAAAWIVMLIMSFKSRKKPSLKKGFKIAFALMIVVIAFILTVEIFGCFVTVRYTESPDDRIYGETIYATDQMYESNGDYDWYMHCYYSGNKNGYTLYKIITRAASVDFYYEIDDAAQILCAQNGYTDFNTNDNTLKTSNLGNWQENYIENPQKYLIEWYSIDNASALYFDVYVLTQTYWDVKLTPQEVFRRNTGIDLATSSQYRVASSGYDYNANVDYIVVEKTQQSLHFRTPNVGWLIMSVLGVAAVYLLTVNCNVEEQIIVKEVASFKSSTVGDLSTANAGQAAAANMANVERFNIVKHIILSVITFGIYQYVWFYRVAQNVRRLCGESVRGCGDEVLLMIIGGPVYRAYWFHTRAKQINVFANGIDYCKFFMSPALYLILSLLTPLVFALGCLTANFNAACAAYNGEVATESEPTSEMTAKLAQRTSLLKTVLLSIVTLGIYAIVVLVRVSSRIKMLSGKQPVNVNQLVCMLLVPFYWIVWLVKRKGVYNKGSNEATLEAWLLLVVPMYSMYWLITRIAELKRGACKYGVIMSDESVWTMLLAIVAPIVSYSVMVINLNKIADALS